MMLASSLWILGIIAVIVVALILGLNYLAPAFSEILHVLEV